MNNWLKIKNNERVDLAKIPVLPIHELREEILALQMRPIAFFGKDWGRGFVRLFVALANDEQGEIYIS